LEFHPDLAIGLIKSLSRLSRKHKKVDQVFETDRLLNFAESLATEKKFDYFVCGHNHVQGITELSVSPCRYVNLGSWINGNLPYGVFKNGFFKLEEL